MSRTTDVMPQYGLDAKIAAPMVAPTEFLELVNEVRNEHHADTLEHARIAVVFIPKAPKSQGNVKLGQARALSAVDRLLSEYDFELRFGWDCLQELPLDARRALIDHELSHCNADVDDNGEVKWVVRGHDVEEFASIIERHGLWRQELEEFDGAMRSHLKQQTFTEGGAAE